METCDPVKIESNGTVGFFRQWKMECFTKCLLTILKLVSLKLGVIDKLQILLNLPFKNPNVFLAPM